MNAYRKKLLLAFNGIAGAGHIISSILLLVLAYRNQDNEIWEPALRTRYEIWTRLDSCNGTDALNATSDTDCFTTSRGSTEPYGINVLAMCAVFAFWSGVWHIWVLMPWNHAKERYFKDIEMEFNRFRWVDYALSASLMIVVISIYAGIDETWFLVGIGLAQAIVIFLGGYGEWLGSQSPDRTMESKILFYVTTVFYAFAVWGPIWQSFVLSIDKIPGTEEVDKALIYGIFGSFTFVFSGFAMIYAINLFFSNGFLCFGKVSYGFIELLYVILSLVSKTLLHWILFYAIFQRSDTLSNEVFQGNPKTSLNQSSIEIVLAVILSLGFVSGIVAGWLWRRGPKTPAEVNAKGQIEMQTLIKPQAGMRSRAVHFH